MADFKVDEVNDIQNNRNKIISIHLHIGARLGLILLMPYQKALQVYIPPVDFYWTFNKLKLYLIMSDYLNQYRINSSRRLFLFTKIFVIFDLNCSIFSLANVDNVVQFYQTVRCVFRLPKDICVYIQPNAVLEIIYRFCCFAF